MNYFRNIETGEIKTTEPGSPEEAKLKQQRTFDGRFPLYEQTGAHDADPEQFASPEEVAARERWAKEAGVALSDVTADGYGQSSDSAHALHQDSAVHGFAELPEEASRPARRRSSAKATAAKD